MTINDNDNKKGGESRGGVLMGESRGSVLVCRIRGCVATLIKECVLEGISIRGITRDISTNTIICPHI